MSVITLVAIVSIPAFIRSGSAWAFLSAIASALALPALLYCICFAIPKHAQCGNVRTKAHFWVGLALMAAIFSLVMSYMHGRRNQMDWSFVTSVFTTFLGLLCCFVLFLLCVESLDKKGCRIEMCLCFLASILVIVGMSKAAPRLGALGFRHFGEKALTLDEWRTLAAYAQAHSLDGFAVNEWEAKSKSHIAVMKDMSAETSIDKLPLPYHILEMKNGSVMFDRRDRGVIVFSKQSEKEMKSLEDWSGQVMPVAPDVVVYFRPD